MAEDIEYVATEELFLNETHVANPGDRFLATPEQVETRGWADKVSVYVPGEA